MKCPICGRKIKNPKSLELGYGPVCYRRMFGEANAVKGTQPSESYELDKFLNYEVPGQISFDDYLKNDT